MSDPSGIPDESYAAERPLEADDERPLEADDERPLEADDERPLEADEADEADNEFDDRASAELAARLPLKRSWVVRGSGKFRQRGRQVKTDPTLLGEFSTIQGFWTLMNNLPAPTEIPIGANIFISQEGVTLVWEDARNKGSGRWTTSMDAGDVAADTAWTNLYCMLVGETLGGGENVVGIAMIRRRDYSRISAWVAADTAVADVKRIGASLKESLGLARIDYQLHGADYDDLLYTL